MRGNSNLHVLMCARIQHADVKDQNVVKPAVNQKNPRIRIQRIGENDVLELRRTHQTTRIHQ